MPKALHHSIVSAGLDVCAQLCRRAEGGRDVLAELEVRNVAAALGQRRAQHRPVGHALAGRGRNGAADLIGSAFDRCSHRPLHIAADGPCHLTALCHGLCKAVRGQALGTVAPGVLGVVVDLHFKTVGTGGLTVTCYYKAKEDRPSASFIITDESGAEADKTLKAGKFKAKLTLPEGRKTAAVIIAKYVNGTLGDLKMSEPKETQAIIETDFITVTGEDLTKQTEIKAFVFESTENIKPMYGFQHIIK